MMPSEEKDPICSKIAMIESFYVLVHDVNDGYQIVEKKMLPDDTLIIDSPVFRFFHKSLVDALIKLGGSIRAKERVTIFSPTFGVEWNDFFVVEIDDTVNYSKLHEVDYQPSIVNELKETGAIFFSKEAVAKLKEEGLPVIELSPFLITPAGGV